MEARQTENKTQAQHNIMNLSLTQDSGYFLQKFYQLAAVESSTNPTDGKTKDELGKELVIIREVDLWLANASAIRLAVLWNWLFTSYNWVIFNCYSIAANT